MSVTPLISAEWLADRLGDAGILLIDIRSTIDGGAAAAYAQAHVPGAVHTDYTKEGWRANQGIATGMLPDMAFLSALFGRLGLTPAHHAILVSAGTSPGDFCAAARVYWTLKVANHDRVSILDGGMAAWGNRPTEAGVVTPKAAPPY